MGNRQTTSHWRQSKRRPSSCSSSSSSSSQTYIHIYIGQMDSDTLTLERLCRSMLRPVHVLPIMTSASFAIGSYGGSKMAEWLVREWNTGDNSEYPWKQ